MKKSLLFILSIFSFTVYSQTTNWEYFVESKGALNMAGHGNDLWLSTNAGLVKFNKTTYAYTFFDKINSPLPSNFITAMATTANGDLWLAADNYSSVGITLNQTYRSSLLKYDGTSWTEFNQGNSLMPDGRIRQIAIDTLGNKWYLNNDNALVKFDNTNFTVYDTSNTPVSIPYFLSLCTDINNNVWVGTYEGLYKFDGTTWTNYNTTNSGILSNMVFALASDSNGKLWVGTANSNPADGGLNSFDGSIWTSYNTSTSGLPENWVSTISIDDSDHVWLLTGGSGLGVTKFDGTSWQAYNTSNSGIISDYSRCLSEDATATWIGSYYGLSRFDGSTWTTFDLNQTGLPNNRIWDIGIDHSDTKYFPTDLGEGLVTYGSSGWSTDTSLDAKIVSNVIELDNNDHIWKGSYWDNELKKYDGVSWQSYNVLNSPVPSTTMYSLCVDHLNNAWTGTENYGLGKFNGSSWTVYDTSNSAIGYNTISSIDEDTLGNMWLGNLTYFTAGFYHPVCGLRKFDGTAFTQLDTANSAIISNEVGIVKCDRFNNVWFSTTKGLSKYDGTGFTDYTPANSLLPHSVIRCINIDLNDVVWVGTDSGMLSFDGASWMLYNQTNSDLPLDGVSAIKVDSYNNKWIAFGQQHPLGYFEGYGATVFNENGIQGLALTNHDISIASDAVLYPNPFADNAVLRISKTGKSLNTLSVYDITGKKITEHAFTGNEISIRREQMKNGMYFYTVTDEFHKQIAKGKFIVAD